MRTLVLALLLSGCGVNLATTALNPAPHPMSAVATAAIPVYSTGAPLRPHVDVALIGVQSSLLRGSQDEVVAALRAQAAALGCDAVVVLDALGRSRVEGIVGTCIAYTDGRAGSVSAR